MMIERGMEKITTIAMTKNTQTKRREKEVPSAMMTMVAVLKAAIIVGIEGRAKRERSTNLAPSGLGDNTLLVGD